MRKLKSTGAAAALLLLAALALGMGLLRASLPRLDGALAEVGLTSAVRIARDSRGVPTIEAADRPDLAYATGFVHAQDRSFPMGLSRRLAAAEPAALFGAGAAAAGNQRAARRRAVRRALEVRPQLPLSGRNQLGCAGGAFIRGRDDRGAASGAGRGGTRCAQRPRGGDRARERPTRAGGRQQQ